jgi:hypothetical protein
MNAYTFSCKVSVTEPDCPLNLNIFIDGNSVFNKKISSTQDLSFELHDDNQEHKIQFTMTGKLPEDTKIDDQGNLVKNPMIQISDIKFENINCDLWVWQNAVYRHDFNGAQEKFNDTFSGSMGCNGTVTFNYTCPIYVWLLDILL